MLFRKCGCLVAHEIQIFQKIFSVDRKILSFDPEIILRLYFTFKPFPDLDTEEREIERARRETGESGIELAPSSSTHRPKPKRAILLWVRSSPPISSSSRSRQDCTKIVPPSRSCQGRAFEITVPSLCLQNRAKIAPSSSGSDHHLRSRRLLDLIVLL